MKTKTSKQPKQSKPTVQLKDMKPKRNQSAGATKPSTGWGASTYQYSFHGSA